MKTASVIAGSGEAGVMVLTPAPGMANSIVSSPAAPARHSPAAPPETVFVFAAMMASRSVHWPSLAATSAVLLTVIVAARADAGARSSAAEATAQARPRRDGWNTFISTLLRRPSMCPPVFARCLFADCEDGIYHDTGIASHSQRESPRRASLAPASGSERSCWRSAQVLLGYPKGVRLRLPEDRDEPPAGTVEGELEGVDPARSTC